MKDHEQELELIEELVLTREISNWIDSLPSILGSLRTPAPTSAVLLHPNNRISKFGIDKLSETLNAQMLAKLGQPPPSLENERQLNAATARTPYMIFQVRTLQMIQEQEKEMTKQHGSKAQEIKKQFKQLATQMGLKTQSDKAYTCTYGLDASKHTMFGGDEHGYGTLLGSADEASRIFKTSRGRKVLKYLRLKEPFVTLGHYPQIPGLWFQENLKLILVILGIVVALVCCLCCCRKAFYYLGCCFMCEDAGCVQNLYGEKAGHVDPKKNKSLFPNKVALAEEKKTSGNIGGIPSYYFSSKTKTDYNSYAKAKETPAQPEPKASAIPVVVATGEPDIWASGDFELPPVTKTSPPVSPAQAVIQGFPEGEPAVILDVSEPQEVQSGTAEGDQESAGSAAKEEL